MRKLVTLGVAALLCLSLSGCFALAVGAAGAGGGYIYKEEQDKGKAP